MRLKICLHSSRATSRCNIVVQSAPVIWKAKYKIKQHKQFGPILNPCGTPVLDFNTVHTLLFKSK